MLISNREEVFNKTKKHHLEFFQYYNDNIKPIDINKLCSDFKTENINLCNEWVKSLESGNPDYSIYDKDEYLTESYLCWYVYSREYMLRLKKFVSVCDKTILDANSIKSVLDLGCGIAYTTIALSTIFPNAKLYGTNKANSSQILFDKDVTVPFDNIEILDDNFSVDSIDVLVALEFFEHIYEPIELLKTVIEHYKPQYLIFANTFGQMAPGHFKEYMVDSKIVQNKKLPRIFTKTLNSCGYYKVETDFYNNRPSIYKHVNSKQYKLF